MLVTSSTTWSIATSELSLAGAPLTVRPDKRARRLRLRLDTKGLGLTLTVPPGVSRRRALAWAAEHEEWALEALGRRGGGVALAPGAVVPLFGLPHVVDWSAERPRRVCVEPGRLACGGPLEGLQARLVRWLRAEALAVLTADSHEFAGKRELKVERVSVGDPRSRWGSCSSSGTIRYSWRLILAPEFVRRATVAHEVAHLVHMNHAPAFHALVAELLEADPAPAREWLRREGATLHRIAA
jgi:predicted metal-dependent hydrolase